MPSLLKSFITGLGTGSGVAWPLFGITCAILGASIGGPLSLALGATSICLFFSVSIPIFYFSYMDELKNELQQQNLFNKNNKKLHASIENYLQCIYKHYAQDSHAQVFTDYCERIINKDLHDSVALKTNSALSLLLELIQQQHELMKNNPPSGKFKHIARCVCNNIPLKSLPFSKLVIPAFFGFVGTFGSIAGGSAGVAGLLTGLGIFSSFSAFPLLGWTILGAAVLMGSFVAICAALQAEEHYQTQELINDLKKMHHQLNKATLERNLNATILKATEDLNPSAKKTEFSATIKKQIFSVLHHNPEKHSNPSLKSMSFFKLDKNTSSSGNEDSYPLFPTKSAVLIRH